MSSDGSVLSVDGEASHIIRNYTEQPTGVPHVICSLIHGQYAEEKKIPLQMTRLWKIWDDII